MKPVVVEERLKALEERGGVLYFAIEKNSCLFKGAVILYPASCTPRRVLLLHVFKNE